MRFLLTDRSRAGLLVVCIGLIGGTGCITMAVINSAQQSANRRAYEKERRKVFEDNQASAAQGNLLAQTRVALEYISGPPDVAQDISKGVALLEQLAIRKYGPAQYALGLLLTTGRNAMGSGSITSERLPRQPQRGVELIKQSATMACDYNSIDDRSFAINYPANNLSEIYRSGGIVEKDSGQADLWLARSILHCGYHAFNIVQYKFMSGNSPASDQKTTVLAWAMLMRHDTSKVKSLENMSAEEKQAAAVKAESLRRLVAESELQYPAPPKPTAQAKP